MRPCSHVRVWTFLLTVVVLVALSACRKSEPGDSPVSPLAEQSSFPSPLPSPEKKQGPVFTISQPVLAGSREVTGSGPAGVPIFLVDVTEVGRQLAATTIDKDGKFLFELVEDLVAGHSVGLMIGDLEGTSFNYEDFLYGDTYYDRPLIGVLLDMAPVVAP